MRDPTEDERIRKLKALATNPGTPEEGQAALTAIGRVIVGEDKRKEVEREKDRRRRKEQQKQRERWERYHDREPIREPIRRRVAAALNQAQVAFYHQQAADLLQRFHGALTATEVGSLNRIIQLPNVPTERDKARIIDIEIEALLRTGQAALPTKEEKEEALRKWMPKCEPNMGTAPRDVHGPLKEQTDEPERHVYRQRYDPLGT